MKYLKKINTLLEPNVDSELNQTVVDLFAGCGGLSLGFESAGFKTIGYEMNIDASNSYNQNLLGDCHNVKLDLATVYPEADILIGGPPCQPFSVGGKQLGLQDSRDGFPIFIDAVTKINPEIFLFENVRGLLYKNKKYLEEILNELEVLGYKITVELLNAKYYGVPQNRERVIVIGARSRINLPTRQKELVTVGDAIGDTADTFDEDSKFLTESMDRYILNYEKASKCVNPRDLYMDRPSRTLTCRNLAGATGDMHRVKLSDGRRRRITVREAARIQSFPDSFQFSGSESSQYKQIGNSVAPYFALQLANSVKQYICSPDELDSITYNQVNQISLFNEPSPVSH